MNIISKFLIFMIKGYQILFPLRKPCCRFIPSCSVYAITAIKKYGPFKGAYLSIKRILKCRPCNFGYDPVP